MTKEELLERNTRIANAIMPVIQYIDILRALVTEDELRDATTQMFDHSGRLMAVPFAETMNRGDEEALQAKTISAIADLYHARQAQADREDGFVDGTELLARLGVE